MRFNSFNHQLNNQAMLLKGLVLVIACAMTACSTTSAESSAPVIPEVAVTVSNTGCEPGNLSVATGKTTFVIKNTSDRPVEWEILEGVMVLEERENIAPGFTQKLTANLESGEYQMRCGLLSNPKGALKVATAK
jgi:iron uptake system component EfeO